ncbi:hypothetical protein CHS0354_016349, partial [Potamilus streckersoni]
MEARRIKPCKWGMCMIRHRLHDNVTKISSCDKIASIRRSRTIRAFIDYRIDEGDVLG